MQLKVTQLAPAAALVEAPPGGAVPDAVAGAPAAVAGNGNAAATAVIPLPTLTDSSSIATYITSVVSIVVGIIALWKPGFTEPAAVQAAIPAVAFLVATGAQIYNAISHRNAHAAVAVAAINQGGRVTT